MSNEKPAWLSERCPITLKNFSEIGLENVIILPCIHKFEREAILCHLRLGRKFCPVCRLFIDPASYGVTPNHHLTQISSNMDDEESDSNYTPPTETSSSSIEETSSDDESDTNEQEKGDEEIEKSTHRS